MFFYLGGYLKWFRTESKVDQSYLCSKYINSEFLNDTNRIKQCGIFDLNLNCIDEKNCSIELPLICETNCTKRAFSKTQTCLDYGSNCLN